MTGSDFMSNEDMRNFIIGRLLEDVYRQARGGEERKSMFSDVKND
jgi:hypothetical protein